MTVQMTPRTHVVTFYQGDDLAELQRLAAAVESAKQAEEAGASRLMHEADPVSEAKEAHDRFLAEATERAVVIELRALGRKAYRELTAKHPPREGNATDERIGVNDETFGDDLVPACIVRPTFPTDAERDAFLDSLSSAQFDELYATAFVLNRTAAPSPKALSEPSLSSR